MGDQEQKWRESGIASIARIRDAQRRARDLYHKLGGTKRTDYQAADVVAGLKMVELWGVINALDFVMGDCYPTGDSLSEKFDPVDSVKEGLYRLKVTIGHGKDESIL